ncbi:MAG: hypothetical protein LBB89_02590 [Treponema sp.]|nr:hypothetical protein [Treponema sp.]
MKILLLILVLALGACDNGDDSNKPDVAKNQTATRTLVHGVGSITITGFMTNAQWKGVADNIQTGINARLSSDILAAGEDTVVNYYKGVFARGITYIIEPEPVGYNSHKTTGDGKTAYVALGKIDTAGWTDTMAAIGQNQISQDGTIIGKAGKVQGVAALGA